MTKLNLEHIRPLQEELDNHPVYGDLQSLANLRVLMSHHIFSAWDFMSLIKYLQSLIAPIQVPWRPQGDPSLRYFINHLVSEEESCQLPGTGDQGVYGSHFELYLTAMDEIDADTQPLRHFLERVQEDGVMDALESDNVPEPSRRFSETTFCLINEDKPHMVAAALALARENLIPVMFRRFLERMEIGKDLAPSFHYYLQRHINLGKGFRGPLSMQMLETLCEGDELKLQEAEAAAEEAICARIRFWDGVHEAIQARDA